MKKYALDERNAFKGNLCESHKKSIAQIKLQAVPAAFQNGML